MSNMTHLTTHKRKLNTAEIRKAGTLIAAAHCIQQDVFGEASVDVCEAAREAGYSLLRRYGCEDRVSELLVPEDIEEMVRNGDI